MTLEPLRVLVGEWTATVGDLHAGRVVFEWALGEAFLIQRSQSPPEFPDGLAVIAAAGDGGYLQHYFDSRGVVRLYRMTLRDGRWTLLRTEPDFSPLDFAQRFEGTFSAAGDTVEGRWETSRDGGQTWEVDFPLTYTRQAR
jgi:hypothetical protein